MQRSGSIRATRGPGNLVLPFEVRQSFCGYVIRGNEGPPILLQIAQGLVLALGAGFVAAALAVAVLSPGESFSIVRFGASAVLAAIAVILLHYATRGAVVELHVDLAQGELREVVRHRIGPATTVGRHGFDPSATLDIRRCGAPDALQTLILRHRGRPEGLCIAQGPEQALADLRVRLQHDMRLLPRSGPRTADVLAA